MSAARRSCVALAVAVSALWAAPGVFAQSRSGFEYNGIVHVSWWINEYNNFDQPTGQGTDSRAALAATRASWAALLVTWYQNDAAGSVSSPSQPGIIFRRPAPHIQNEEPKTPSDVALRFAIRELKSRGLRVMLKPHVDAVNGAWRGDFSPSNLDGWFQSYTQFITHYAQMAQEEGVEAFVMGTEFRNLTGAANRTRWIAVIGAVRSLYGGVVTYAANATFPADEFTAVSFWDQVDVIGLDAYFNLTDSTSPTQAQLVAAWRSNRFGENAVANVQNLASAHQKPVIFTELGYKSVDGANREPWNFGLGGAVDAGEQRDCYEAAFTVWSQQSTWMRGILWWAWPVPPPGTNDTDYNPRGKLAEQTLRDWQGPSTPRVTLTASPASLSVNRGASGTSTVGIARSGGFTGAVSLSASGLPSGVTAGFSPGTTTGNTSTLTLTAVGTAAPGTSTVTVTATGGGLRGTTAVSLTVNGTGGGTGGVTVTPVIATSSPWYNEQDIRLSNTGSLTALSITIVVQRTAGIGLNGQYNTVGGQILQSNSVTAATITYQFTLASGQTLGAGTNRLFAAQTGGTGTVHPMAGDTYTVTYTTGGVSYTQSGHF